MRILAAILLAVIPAGAALKNADHWSYHPPQPIEGTSIDQFVRDRLQRDGLSLNPPADRRVLIRRLTFDLHGLPPTPEAVKQFLDDHSPRAVANLVDRLLESPRYGERWARHWLDIVRFSESQGFERDKIRPDAWPYRDYVIDSFNRDKPYDQFVREQIAGDVIEPVTRDGIIATGFLVAGPWDEVGNGQKSQVMRMRVREEELEDLISAVGQTFLGVTINCARCHDHKFDPIPQADYYAIKAVFAGVFHGTRTYLTPKDIQRREQKAQRLFAEFVAADQRRRELKRAAIRQLTPRPGPQPFHQWTFDGETTDLIRGLPGYLFQGAKVENGRLILDGKSAHMKSAPLPTVVGAKTLEGWVKLTDLDQRRGAVVSLYQDPGSVFDAIVYGERKPRAWMAGSDHFKRTVDQPNVETNDQSLIHVAVTYATDNTVALYRNGRLLGRYTPKHPLQEFDAKKAFLYFGRRTRSGYLKGEIEEVRIYDRALSAAEVRRSFAAGPVLFSVEQIAGVMTADDRKEYESLSRQTRDLDARLKQAQDRPLVYAARVRQPPPTHFLDRGDVKSKGEIVAPRALAAISHPPADLGLSADSADADRRRRFAAWLTDSRNPLVARVMVNRIWQYHFGRGLVDTPSDLGVSGSRPSHPELLDWLAAEFVRNGWSIKQLHRRILTSATYLQSSRFNETAARQDAENRLLWRFPPRRLEAEAVRDSMLALSGELNLQMGGPGYRPFDLVIDNTHFYFTKDKLGPEFNRRTIYRIGVQSLRQPLLDSLDCPDLSTKTPVRGVTTTPIQALALMNDSFVQRQARFMARRLAREAGENATSEQVRRAYQLVYGRPPTARELSRSAEHIRRHGLPQLCWVLLNSSEFIYVR